MIRRIAIAMTCCAAAWICAFVAPLPAQEPATLAPGAVVRWTDRGGGFQVEGPVRSVHGDSIDVALTPGTGVISLSINAVPDLAVRDGRRSRAPGALIGAAIGAAGGALFGSHDVGNDCTPSSPLFCDAAHGFAAEATAVGFAAVGAAVGALIGAAVPPGWHWHLVNGTPHRIAVQPLVTWHTKPVVGLRFTF